MSARTELVAELRRIAGDTVQVIGVEDNADVPDRMRIMVKQRSVGPLPQAPAGNIRVGFILTITHPATDPRVSEIELDDYVAGLMATLTNNPWFGVDGDATKTIDIQNLAYDLPCFVIAGPTN